MSCTLRRRGSDGDSCGHSRRSEGAWPGQDLLARPPNKRQPICNLCAIKLDNRISQLCFNPASHLVFVPRQEQASYVWVAEKQQVASGELTCFELFSLIENIKTWHTKDSSRRRCGVKCYFQGRSASW